MGRFLMNARELPPEWEAEDVTCSRFFENRRGQFGGGGTPQAAYEDLLRILRNRP